MANSLTHAEIHEYQIVFDFIATDSKGRKRSEITFEMLQTLMASLGMADDTASLSKTFATRDTDGSGTIDFDEFIDVALEARRPHLSCSVDRLREAFDTFASGDDNPGLISIAALTQALMHYGPRLNKEDAEDLVAEVLAWATKDATGDPAMLDYARLCARLSSN